MYKYFIIILFPILFLSCGKEKVQSPKQDKPVENQVMDEDTTSLSPEEAFSSTLVNDILNVDDEDLQSYLEEEFYPKLKNSEKVTIDKISSSLYILTYYEKGTEKNLMIQKFYNPITYEMFFESKEIQTNAVKQFIR
jgi:hypothetical protein